jgi:hypothetical protein
MNEREVTKAGLLKTCQEAYDAAGETTSGGRALVACAKIRQILRKQLREAAIEQYCDGVSPAEGGPQ